MVLTRSQSKKNNQPETEIMSDNKSDHSRLDILSTEQMIEFDNDAREEL